MRTLNLKFLHEISHPRYRLFQLEQEKGITPKMVDLRWLAPLPKEAILNEVKGAKAILIVDEGRQTGGISEHALLYCMRIWDPCRGPSVLSVRIVLFHSLKLGRRYYQVARILWYP